MCGRYKRKISVKDAIKHFEIVDNTDYFDIHGYKMKEEVRPGTPIFAINNHHIPEDIWWTIRGETWDGKTVDAINAKAENLLKAKMFKDAFLSDRVLIPATGLYEWHTNPDKSKTKYEIWFDEPVFAFAGIARDCEIGGETKRCGVIVTTSPNDIFSEIHNTKQRQAVVIRQQDYEKWLDPKAKYEDLKPLLHPLPNEETHAKIAGT